LSRVAWNQDPTDLSLPHSLRACATAPSYWLRWGLKSFCPSWPGIAILLISAFQVARITGMSHRCPARIS
jgi:hypothetical protein